MNFFKRFLLIWLIFLFLFLIIFSYFLPLLSYQEARRVVITQETFSGSLLIPTFNGEPYFTKPPLYTWISLTFYGLGIIFSKEVFFLRLISLGSYMILSYVIYLILKKDLIKTLISLFILFGSFRFLSFSYRIDLEPLFVLFTTLSIYFLLRFREEEKHLYVYLFYFFFALAYLVRGPLHFFLWSGFLFYILMFRDKKLLKLILFPKGWFFFFCLTFSWYLYGYLKFGFSVFQEFLKEDLTERLIPNHKDPFWYYFKAFFLSFFPYLFLLAIKFKTFKRDIIKNLPSEHAFYFFSFAIPILFLSFTGEKFDKYLFFLYPLCSLFFTEILLKLYKINFLLKISLLLTSLNFLAVLLVQSYGLEELKYKLEIVKKTLPVKENLVFYLEVNPLFIYLYKKPIPVIKDEKELPSYLEKNFLILSPKEIKSLPHFLVLPDPYKKKKIWYIYKNSK